MLNKTQLNTVLEDDTTSTGGVAFEGETLRDFLEDTGLIEEKDLTIEDVNRALKECGIKCIK